MYYYLIKAPVKSTNNIKGNLKSEIKSGDEDNVALVYGCHSANLNEGHTELWNSGDIILYIRSGTKQGTNI